MRLMSSDQPCSISSVIPTGIATHTGQRIRPPGLPDTSPDWYIWITTGMLRYRMVMHSGVRKSAKPTMSIHTCTFLGKRLLTTSMRTCSRLSSVQPAAIRKDHANRYHCTSRKALELVSNALRTMALAALMKVDAKMSQIEYLPTNALSLSMARDSESKACMVSPRRWLGARVCPHAGWGMGQIDLQNADAAVGRQGTVGGAAHTFLQR